MAKKETFPAIAKRLYNNGDGWPIWKIAKQLKVTESQVVAWLRLK